MTSSDRSWYAEIDLAVDRPHPAMGTRNLGDRRWLIVDDLWELELAYKHHLLAERYGEVFAALDGSELASSETLKLVEADLDGRLAVGSATEPSPENLHPLDAAGQMAQEDLCLMRPGPDGWVLGAATLCFPSQWSLAEKLGAPMAAIHGPVPGYAEVLDRRVDSLFDQLAHRLNGRIVWRRNWFLRPAWDMFQPTRLDDDLCPADRCLVDMYFRSERQTLRVLPESGWILFTIRTQHAPLGEVIADAEQRVRFTQFVNETDENLARSHSITSAQLSQLRTLMDAPA